MCSHKSFIPALSDLEEIQFWISSMSLELESRMQAEFAETERWPRTIALGFFGGRQAWKDQQDGERRASFRAPHKGSRSMPLGSRFEYGGMEGIARKMYGVVEKLIKESETGGGRPVLPLILLTITVSNFSEGRESAMGEKITKFFSKAPVPSRQTQQPSVDQSYEVVNGGASEARDPIQNPTSGTVKPSETKDMNARRRFFQPRAIVQDRDRDRDEDDPSTGSIQHLGIERDQASKVVAPSSPHVSTSRRSSPVPQDQSDEATATILCDQCPSPGQRIPVEDWEQHTDYHFALRLLEDDKKQQQMERQQQRSAPRVQGADASTKRNPSSGSSTPSTRGKRRKTATVPTSSSSGSTSSNTSGTGSLSKFFRPSAN